MSNRRRRAGIWILAVGVTALVYQFVVAFTTGPGAVHEGRVSLFRWFQFFLPYLVFLVGLQLFFGGRRKEEKGPDKPGVRLVKILVGGWAAAGAVFLVMLPFALLFFGSEGVDMLFKISLPFMVVVTTILSLTLMKKLQ